MLHVTVWRIALVLLLLFGCSDDPPLVAGATIEVAPLTIDFGKVATGETRSVELHVRNLSPAGVLKIIRIGIQEGSAPVFTLSDAPEQVEAGTEITVLVTYTPDDGEPDAGHLFIETNALNGGLVLVPLSSDRTFPKIAVDPPQLNLGHILTGGTANASLEIQSTGDATLLVSRVSLRTAGFVGEACGRDSDCQEGRCTPSRTGRICALACTDQNGCSAGYLCTTGVDGYRACREDHQTAPPLAIRGFVVSSDTTLEPLPPGRSTSFDVTYAPAAEERGNAQLVLESNDGDRPVVVVPLIGHPENLPPVASATVSGALPDPIEPGTVLSLTGEGSFDPEGSTITYAWRFVRRPEGSRAVFVDPAARDTSFAVDHPGSYAALLAVRDETGLTSTNNARVEITATAGNNVRVTLEWSRPGTDLDLHLVSPGAPVGSLGDCYYENPMPDWPPVGSGGDPTFAASNDMEGISVTSPADGVYTMVVTVVASSPAGPTTATARIYLQDVEVSVFDATLTAADASWDVATLTWPIGRITPLGTIR